MARAEPSSSPIQEKSQVRACTTGRLTLSAKVCLLAPDHAEALEERGVIPDCRFHEHTNHRAADLLTGVMRIAGKLVEAADSLGREVRSIDGRRRITPVRQVLRYVSKPCSHSEFGIGITSMQAVTASGAAL